MVVIFCEGAEENISDAIADDTLNKNRQTLTVEPVEEALQKVLPQAL